MFYISSKSTGLIVHFNLPCVFQRQEENATDHLLDVIMKEAPWVDKYVLYLAFTMK